MDFFSFEGRIGRGEYWGLSILLAFLGIVLFFVLSALFPPLAIVWFIAMIVSSWSIGTRRCHDLGWSGAVQLVGLIPVFGNLFLFVALGFVPGQTGPNKYGYADGYVPQYVDSGSHVYMSNPTATPHYLQAPAAIHPSLREANDRAWHSSSQEYRG